MVQMLQDITDPCFTHQFSNSDSEITQTLLPIHTQAADTHIVHLYSEVVRIRKYKSHYRVVSYISYLISARPDTNVIADWA